MSMIVHVMDVNDVGRKPQYGDCFLVDVEGKFILIDGGVHHAGRKVREYLDKVGVNTLGLTIVTHVHSDHVDGINLILREDRKRVKIKQVWATDPKYLEPIAPPRDALLTLTVDFKDPGYAEFDSPGFTIQSIASYHAFEELLWETQRIRPSYPTADEAPDPKALGIPDLSIEVLGPSHEMLKGVLRRLKQLRKEKEELIAVSEGLPPEKINWEAFRRLYDSESDAINNTSLIVKITYKQKSILFTGDAEIASLFTGLGGELPYKMRKNLQKKMRNVNVFKAPHHGSKNGIDAEGKILDLVQPKNVVITARAKDNAHPYPGLLEQLKERRIPYYLTTRNRDGIMITTDGLTEPDFGDAKKGGYNPGTRRRYGD